MKDILKGLIFVGLFAVPFLTLYVENDFFFPFITGKNFAFRIIVEIVFAAWVLLALYDKTYRPRFSWLVATFGFLTVVMFLSSLLAQHPLTAFFSNYERMDGYITLVHVFAYFLVIGTMFRTPQVWSYLLHTSIIVAAIVSLRGLAQLDGQLSRIDSTLGNAAYMAVYMLFHVFFLAYLFVQTKVTPYRIIYALLALLFVYTLLQTGTRGTAIGLVVGTIVSVAYIALFATRSPQVRRYALIGCAILVVCGSIFYMARDTEYVQSNVSLARIANIDLGDDLRIRSIIWGMSVEGIKERPILGWGNGNFNYVFNAEYDPRLYAQEQWFDRVHNIFFDWLIAGGIIGLLSYLSIFAAIFYYLFVVPWRGDNTMDILERGVLAGLFAGYFTHNVVVFDNIISYIFFAVALGLLHSRYSQPNAKIQAFTIPPQIINNVAAPIVGVVAIAMVYFINVPSMQAAAALINGFETQDYATRLDYFEEALNYNSFARQEIVEQLAQQTMGMGQALAQNPTAFPSELVDSYMALTESELSKLVENKPGDARLHVFLASYYRAISQLEKAQSELAIARTLSPKKQAIILQQGAVEFAIGNYEAAKNFFKEAYELDTANSEAKEFYFAMLLYTNDKENAGAILETADTAFLDRVAMSDFVLGAASTNGDYEALASLYEHRVTIASTTAQNWASLAYTYYQMKDIPKAVDTLKRATVAVPSFASTAACVTKNLEAGLAPEVGCQ